MRPSFATSRFLLAILAAGALALGCPDITRMGKNYGHVELIKEGMHYEQVLSKIGEPEQVIRGKGLRINWQELVYPGGSVFLYRLRVQKVLPRSMLKTVPEDEEKPLGIPFKDPDIFQKKK